MFLQREELKRFINSICRVTKYFKVFLNKKNFAFNNAICVHSIPSFFIRINKRFTRFTMLIKSVQNRLKHKIF